MGLQGHLLVQAPGAAIRERSREVSPGTHPTKTHAVRVALTGGNWVALCGRRLLQAVPPVSPPGCHVCLKRWRALSAKGGVEA